MITKDKINELKLSDLSSLYRILKESGEIREITFILENLGRLPLNFDANIFEPFLHHSNNEIRINAVKNLGKVSNPKWIDCLEKIAQSDKNSLIRREAVSSIGRMRSKQAIPKLIELLQDSDPKVVLQAIRGLIVFRENLHVKNALIKLENHPNEMVQSVIQKELNRTKLPAQGVNSSNSSHASSPDFMKNVVVEGDVCETMRYIPNDSIHLTFTSPPYYNARDYSIYPSYAAYLDFLTTVFTEIYRITKEGRFMIVNTSPVIVPRVSRAHASKRYPIPFDLHTRLVTNGWEFIDDIVWLKPETSVKNRNGGFMQHRKPLGYKPNPVTEYLMVYRKRTDKLLDWNMRSYSENIISQSRIQGSYETSNVWKVDPTFDKIHSAVFPIELCNRVISFYSYSGDLVFDPFGGSGTLGKSAQNLGRYSFLTEQETKYVDRMKTSFGQNDLLNKHPVKFYSLAEFKHVSQQQNPNDYH